MKQRFSSLDIKILAHELSKSLVTLRVSNIYDLSSRIFLIKFAKPKHRELLLIDSGFRCHLTSFDRTTAGTPSAFVSRLRKFLKTRRVTSVSQVGTDRILELQFSEGQYRLFLEFYAGGNIVLTDRELNVIALLRIVNEGAEHERLHPGIKYNLTERQNFNGTPAINLETIRAGIEKYDERLKAQAATAKTSKSKKKAGDHLTRALSAAINQFPPPLIEHVLRSAELDVSTPAEEVLKDDKMLERVRQALENAASIVSDILETEKVKGYIIAKQKSHGNEDPRLAYFDFYPFVPAQFREEDGNKILEFEGFNKTVDEFYSSIEGQKLQSRLQERQNAAKQKLDHARKQQEDRISGLQAVQDQNVRKAEAIEANIERVEEAVAAINGLIGQGMDWVEIDRVIELEQKRGNPVAQVIKLPLKLKENSATLLLDEWVEEEEELEDAYKTGSEPSDTDDELEVKNEKQKQTKKSADKRLAVEIDLAVSAWSNARDYHDQKKTAATKQDKTKESQEIAFRNAKRKIEQDLQKSLKQEKAVLRAVRKQAWFEKFIHFLSSDGYLVLGGRDASQSEILYKRHFSKGDVYVHADLKGAVPMIIKNKLNSADAPIPPTTLGQAGNMSVCTSKAWDSKAVMSAWWASSDQVTKKANTGDHLPPGEVYIKGQKNFLPPAQLILGFAVAFRISEASKSQHTKHRAIDTPNKPLETEVKPVEHDLAESKPQNNGVEGDAIEADHEEDEEVDEDDVENSIHGEEEEEDEDSKSKQGVEDEKNDYSNPLQPSNYTDDVSQPAVPEPSNKVEEREDEQDESDDDDDTNISVTSGQNQSKGKSKPPVRGKRGKKAKIATKYKDQDEEDREAALQILGSRVGQERAQAEVEAKVAAQAKAEEDKERRRQQHLRAQEDVKKREEARLRNEVDAAALDEDEEEAQAAVDLEAYVGTPLPGDEILEAVPLCAPWSALAKYKYKVKLQPGAAKKGKAVKEILSKWRSDATRKGVIDEKSQDTERMWPKEVELIKAFNEAEIINIVPVGKVRVMMSGASSSGGGSKGKGGGRGGKGGNGSRKSR